MQATPLIQELGGSQQRSVNPEVSHDYGKPITKPLIQELDERFERLSSSPTIGPTSGPLIQEINEAPEKCHIEEVPDVAQAPAHGPPLQVLHKLAEQVGSTIDRQPLNIEKEKREYEKRRMHEDLTGLD